MLVMVGRKEGILWWWWIILAVLIMSSSTVVESSLNNVVVMELAPLPMPPTSESIRYGMLGGDADNVFEEDKRTVPTGANPLHNR